MGKKIQAPIAGQKMEREITGYFIPEIEETAPNFFKWYSAMVLPP